MGFKFSYVLTFVLILMGAILAFQSFIHGISHGDIKASPKTRVFWVSKKMRSWVRDEAREVPTGPDPLHHHSIPQH